MAAGDTGAWQSLLTAVGAHPSLPSTSVYRGSAAPSAAPAAHPLYAGSLQHDQATATAAAHAQILAGQHPGAAAYAHPGAAPGMAPPPYGHSAPHMMMGAPVPPTGMAPMEGSWPGPPMAPAPGPVAATAYPAYQLNRAAIPGLAPAPAGLGMPPSMAHVMPHTHMDAAIAGPPINGASVGVGTGRGKRAPRGSLDGHSVEAKMERRKEKARTYSALARKRHESTMKELRVRVESLSVFRLIIDEAPDMVCVLSPDVDAKVVFANEACARVIDTEPSAIKDRSFWEVLHPSDKAAVLKVLSEAILSKGTLAKVRGQVRTQAALGPEFAEAQAGADPGYMRVEITMKYGQHGIVSFIRPLMESGGGDAGAEGDGKPSEKKL